ncbi:MAG TPA: S8 family peptidase [Hanamia sp.]|nr:S8 family peptidase [Hanamia sp.]
MEQFPHLKFIQKLTGKPRLWGGGSDNPNTYHNKQNRQAHSAELLQKTTQLKADWGSSLSTREEEQLAPLSEDIVPLFLQINPDIINAGFDLQALGIEIISEEDDGFIIGASVDNLRSLESKIIEFVNANYGSAKIADLWRIVNGNRELWKAQYILSETLFRKWAEIDDNAEYAVEVSIAFDRPLGLEPNVQKRGGAKRLAKYREKLIERDELEGQREKHFKDFIEYYGELTSSFVWLEDCFGCEVKISGKGLKDLVINYPFVFEVNELEEIDGVIGGNSELGATELEILPPANGAPIVGVIDSGIMQNHRYIEPAIDHGNDKSYLPGDLSTADHVLGGGHGTRVAGAVLYPLGISKYISPYELPCYIRNLRVLDGKNHLPHRYPAELIEQIVNDHEACSIFNLSINSVRVHRRKHMSTWAACIDKEIHQHNLSIIVSAGNIHKDTIREYVKNGINYPSFLNEPYCSIANPGQSCFAITVGSINHTSFEDASWKSLGDEKMVSAFSRIGAGIWGTIKPDVVESGGGLVISKNGHYQVKETNITAPELLRSTLGGGSANGFDAVGTSFATPKVTHIIANLKKLYFDETANLLRALLVQSARLPNDHFINPTEESIRFLGYGIPSLDRATKNTDYRISLYNTATIAAEEGHIYSLKIPQELRNPGDDYEVLIEVTLAYTAKTRRTRQKIKSYLATWLDWGSSKLDEPIDDFNQFAFKEMDGVETKYDKERREAYKSIKWKIGEKSNSGVDNFSRSNNTLQKDWAIIKSYQLSEEIGFIIRGHKGWDKNKEEVPYAFVVSIELLGADVPIYEVLGIENGIEIEVK